MPKRFREDEDAQQQSSVKRRRIDISDRLSTLSDELILKTLLYLPISSLVQCLRVCRRVSSLAGDSELWKQKYYARWIRPRVRRIPTVKASEPSDKQSHLSSKLVNWLDHGHLLQKGRATDWKRQYKLKHNWSKGTCKMKELEVKQPPFAPVLVRLHNGVAFTADREGGLRAWTTRGHKLLASQNLNLATTSWSSPTALGVNTSPNELQQIDVGIGFGNGAFRMYTLDLRKTSFSLRYSRPPSSFGPVTAISPALPYLAIISDNRSISVYKFFEAESTARNLQRLQDPYLIHSLNTPQRNSPITLSLRNADTAIKIGVAFLSPKMNQAWCVGLQEIHLPKMFDPPSHAETQTPLPLFPLEAPPASILSRLAHSHLKFLSTCGSQPISVSYSHPYLLITNPDNTLEICLVTSDKDTFSIGDSRRLWGHTSAVSGAEVSNRGRAVSVAKRGNEVRLWDLEDLVVSNSYSRPKRSSIPITAENPPSNLPDFTLINEAIRGRGDGLGLAHSDVAEETSLTRGWVGFDEEQVIVLREWQPGKQVLSCYDFS